MNRSITILFLLFMLLITGAFASMAQNNYGFTILGWVAMGFMLLFGYQLWRKLMGKKPADRIVLAELGSLVIISLLLGLNCFHVRVPFADYVLSVAALVLLAVYVLRFREHLANISGEQQLPRTLAVAYYGGVILFLAGIVASPFLPQWTAFAGILAFTLLLAFIIGSFVLPGFQRGWKQVHALQVIGRFRDRSFIVASFCFLVSFYGLLVGRGLLPPLYSDDYPKAYFDMQTSGKSGKDDTLRPEQKQQAFKTQYEDFVQQHLGQR